MNLTTMLTEEHKHILKVADAMAKECSNLQTGKELNKEFFEKAVDFIRNYADKFHHAREEDILFEEMDNSLEELHCDPREQMLYEHQQGRELVKNLEKAIKSSDKAAVIKNAKGYAELIQEHIFKEDNILYPMADSAIKPGRQLYILKQSEQVEKEHFRGTKEKYLAIAEELEKML